MIGTIPYPTKARATSALLLAPLLPIAILFAFDAIDRVIRSGPLYIVGAAMLAFYMLVVVEFFTIALGGLTLALLWQRVPFNVGLCIVIGGVVAVLPFVIFGLVASAAEPMNYDAWQDGRATVVDGVKTAYGRWRDFLALAQIFGLGLLGGGFFWWLCRPTGPSEVRPNDR